MTGSGDHGIEPSSSIKVGVPPLALLLLASQEGFYPMELPLSSAEVKNAWNCTSTPQYTFMARCSVKAQEQVLLSF
jgi:hypothetical protein